MVELGEVKEADQRIQVVTEQVRPKLEQVTSRNFVKFQALCYYQWYNDMMKEYFIKIQTNDDKVALVHINESPLAVFPPQVNLLGYLVDQPLDVNFEPDKLKELVVIK